MIEIKASASNKRSLLAARSIEKNTKQGIRRAFYSIGQDLVKTAAAETLKQNKTGRIYNVRGRGRRRRHRASAPGETPANLTGGYRKGLGYEVHSADRMEFGDTAPYAGFLEKGTSKMQPRPGLRNALKATQKNTENYFESFIENNVGGIS